MVQLGGDWAGPQPAQAPVPNVTAHPSTASVPITVLLYVRCSAVLMCPVNIYIPDFAMEVLCAVSLKYRLWRH